MAIVSSAIVAYQTGSAIKGTLGGLFSDPLPSWSKGIAWTTEQEKAWNILEQDIGRSGMVNIASKKGYGADPLDTMPIWQLWDRVTNWGSDFDILTYSYTGVTGKLIAEEKLKGLIVIEKGIKQKPMAILTTNKSDRNYLGTEIPEVRKFDFERSDYEKVIMASNVGDVSKRVQQPLGNNYLPFIIIGVLFLIFKSKIL